MLLLESLDEEAVARSIQDMAEEGEVEGTVAARATSVEQERPDPDVPDIEGAKEGDKVQIFYPTESKWYTVDVLEVQEGRGKRLFKIRDEEGREDKGVQFRAQIEPQGETDLSYRARWHYDIPYGKGRVPQDPGEPDDEGCEGPLPVGQVGHTTKNTTVVDGAAHIACHFIYERERDVHRALIRLKEEIEPLAEASAGNVGLGDLESMAKRDAARAAEEENEEEEGGNPAAAAATAANDASTSRLVLTGMRMAGYDDTASPSSLKWKDISIPEKYKSLLGKDVIFRPRLGKNAAQGKEEDEGERAADSEEDKEEERSPGREGVHGILMELLRRTKTEHNPHWRLLRGVRLELPARVALLHQLRDGQGTSNIVSSLADKQKKDVRQATHVIAFVTARDDQKATFEEIQLVDQMLLHYVETRKRKQQEATGSSTVGPAQKKKENITSKEQAPRATQFLFTLCGCKEWAVGSNPVACVSLLKSNKKGNGSYTNEKKRARLKLAEKKFEEQTLAKISFHMRERLKTKFKMYGLSGQEEIEKIVNEIIEQYVEVFVIYPRLFLEYSNHRSREDQWVDVEDTNIPRLLRFLRKPVWLMEGPEKVTPVDALANELQAILDTIQAACSRTFSLVQQVTGFETAASGKTTGGTAEQSWRRGGAGGGGRGEGDRLCRLLRSLAERSQESVNAVACVRMSDGVRSSLLEDLDKRRKKCSDINFGKELAELVTDLDEETRERGGAGKEKPSEFYPNSELYRHMRVARGKLSRVLQHDEEEVTLLDMMIGSLRDDSITVPSDLVVAGMDSMETIKSATKADKGVFHRLYDAAMAMLQNEWDREREHVADSRASVARYAQLLKIFLEKQGQEVLAVIRRQMALRVSHVLDIAAPAVANLHVQGQMAHLHLTVLRGKQAKFKSKRPNVTSKLEQLERAVKGMAKNWADMYLKEVISILEIRLSALAEEVKDILTRNQQTWRTFDGENLKKLLCKDSKGPSHLSAVMMLDQRAQSLNLTLKECMKNVSDHRKRAYKASRMMSAFEGQLAKLKNDAQREAAELEEKAEKDYTFSFFTQDLFGLWGKPATGTTIWTFDMTRKLLQELEDIHGQGAGIQSPPTLDAIRSRKNCFGSRSGQVLESLGLPSLDAVVAELKRLCRIFGPDCRLSPTLWPMEFYLDPGNDDERWAFLDAPAPTAAEIARENVNKDTYDLLCKSIEAVRGDQGGATFQPLNSDEMERVVEEMRKRRNAEDEEQPCRLASQDEYYQPAGVQMLMGVLLLEYGNSNVDYQKCKEKLRSLPEGWATHNEAVESNGWVEVRLWYRHRSTGKRLPSRHAVQYFEKEKRDPPPALMAPPAPHRRYKSQVKLEKEKRLAVGRGGKQRVRGGGGAFEVDKKEVLSLPWVDKKEAASSGRGKRKAEEETAGGGQSGGGGKRARGTGPLEEGEKGARGRGGVPAPWEEEVTEEEEVQLRARLDADGCRAPTQVTTIIGRSKGRKYWTFFLPNGRRAYSWQQVAKYYQYRDHKEELRKGNRCPGMVDRTTTDDQKELVLGSGGLVPILENKDATTGHGSTSGVGKPSPGFGNDPDDAAPGYDAHDSEDSMS